jgi:dTDP-N-acetylfucosamine:lipid II N-acetylfucosaminyltransferase
MIIHIASDEKFINNAYWQFNNIGEEKHIFYILVQNINEKLSHVKLKKDMLLVSNSESELKRLSKSLTKANLVCFHGLDYKSSIVLNSLPKQTKIFWILFGKEIYNNPYLYDTKKLVGKRTFNSFLIKDTKSRLKSQLKYCFRNLYYLIKEGSCSPFYEITKAMKRADYCGVLYQEEFLLVQQKLGTKIECIKFSYFPIEMMVKNIEDRVSGNNILLGNSASYTNNHLEAFEVLKKVDLGDRKVITPLSYGNELYKKAIVVEGNKVLEKHFIPLINFMPLHEYNNYVKQCSVVVMNHYRQQAAGNVLTALWMGAKVYLNKRSTLYHYLVRIGVHVYEITDDLIPANKLALVPLSEVEIQQNRNCLRKEISQVVLLEELEVFINDIICL